MLAAFALDWSDPQPDGQRLPIAATAVYLGVRKHGTAHRVSDDTSMAIGRARYRMTRSGS
jgi:hypothetical protein